METNRGEIRIGHYRLVAIADGSETWALEILEDGQTLPVARLDLETTDIDGLERQVFHALADE